ncbi:MAG: bifunctional pyr operon transcriptional regulator/uracil phosphoribosyltransferase PyrR [Planctomycetes bacterium]|nr:bifunctional pyr operon transcriptional regulator/uracil phosphoribosyltransferase PyrR [Planctomycetota bacterium]MBU1518613.1 bifunctional pyr operon transcriptional regulator/uracil phosphoribosyltransferase PyrR [Planctomycetota bacterium]MBU2458547.1 bifunctional pyr operon transcriptional regulator/uracil phosphoribosyltransferase PyrR [Planctomycetota bacterium]MBU2597354.1 bifunctional pyr operon transcriptional regulator/uracil phosphoribosyltransferase PyrR [Planctomycetota bacteriu
MEVLLSSDKISDCVTSLADEIVSKTVKDDKIVVIGIRSRGEILAKRLADILSHKFKTKIPCGTLDITLYRDDINNPQGDSQPLVRSTEIGFNIDDKIIILVDDVLYTGRSTRAAMDALIDLGRPKAIRLAVLVERAGREFPIQADFAGVKVEVPADKSVQVNFVESDGKDRVIVI